MNSQVFGCAVYFGFFFFFFSNLLFLNKKLKNRSYNFFKDYFSDHGKNLSFSVLLLSGGLTGIFFFFLKIKN